MKHAHIQRRLVVRSESWEIRGVFRIARGSKTRTRIVVVEIEENDHRGRGEASPIERYGQNVVQVTAQIEAVRKELESGMGRAALQEMLPAGSARNAVDCALWDLEAKLSGRRAWQLAGLAELRPVATAYTVSLDRPEAMARTARANAHRPLLKIKLSGEGDIERVAAVRNAAPGVRLIVDANESWTPTYYRRAAPQMKHLGVELIEQPFAAGRDNELALLERPVPVCADESCHTTDDLEQLTGRYDHINIKLDKTGGLTEALRLQRRARAMGLGIMVGCMVATSLAIAPAMLPAQAADFVDLDGGLLLVRDRKNALVYHDQRLQLPDPELWG